MAEGTKRLNLGLTVVAFLLLAVLLFSNRAALKDTYQLLLGLDWRIVLLLPVAQLLSHVSIAHAYKSFFSRLGNKVPFLRTLPMVWALNFVNQILPSGGTSGIAYLIYGMRGLVPAGKATLAQLVRYALSYFSYGFILTGAFILLIIGQDVTSRSVTFLLALLTFSAFLTVFLLYILNDRRRVDRFIHGLNGFVGRVIGWLRRDKKPQPKLLAKVEEVLDDFHSGYEQISKHREKLLVPFLFMLMSTIFENAIVYLSFVALGVTINPGIVLVSFAIANAVGVISVVPGDVGVHEAAMIGALSAVGVAPATAISATLLYRVFNKMLYLPVGFAAYSRLLKPARISNG